MDRVLPSAPTNLNARERALADLQAELRPGQRSLAEWSGSELAVSAVPGAGKSTGMAVGAAVAIARFQLHPKRQLVVVTFTRSAAAAIKAKIRERLQTLRLPQGGFVVHTLHGLALNIATRHPEFSGLNLETLAIATPTQGHRLLKSAVDRWVAANPQLYRRLLEGQQFDGEETERLRRESALRTEILPNLARTAVREAKSSGLQPRDLHELAREARDEYRILTVAAGLYEQYGDEMRVRALVDYDDMILAALRALENSEIRELWQQQVFAVFEDEAQDSSPLQTQLLEILAAVPETESTRNLVRVGDPNQAINSTFTPADPLYFNRFCDACQERDRLATMARAGRSTPAIIAAANFMLQWVNQRARQQGDDLIPFRDQRIQTVDFGDPQPDANPEPEGGGLELYVPEDVYRTVQVMGDRIHDLLTLHPERSAAILVRENRQARFVAQELAYLERDRGVRIYEVGEVERRSHIPEEMLKLLRFLDRPHSSDNLKSALEVLVARNLVPPQDLNAVTTCPEQFLYPGPLAPRSSPSSQSAADFCRRLLAARSQLPHYQLIAFLGLALRYTGSELATVQKLGDRVVRQAIGNSSLKGTLEALDEIVSSERFEGVEEESDDVYTRANQLTIITMHKAKGLDWDYVFLPFLHEDSIPGEPWVPTGAQFLGKFTLSEVARVQIRGSVHSTHSHRAVDLPLPDGAWDEAARLKAAEEYRLLYVAMTRAKRLLWMSAARRGPFRWGSLEGELQDKRPCPVFAALGSQFPQARCEAEEPF